jgi:hypothetical protein
MNAAIEAILANLIINEILVPVAYMKYEGHGEPYVVYMQYDKDNSYSTDDEIAGYVTYYDFDIYSKGNYLAIVEEIKSRLKSAGWTWQPRRDSPDMYDTDTQYYHKTICFAYPIQEVDQDQD